MIIDFLKKYKKVILLLVVLPLFLLVVLNILNNSVVTIETDKPSELVVQDNEDSTVSQQKDLSTKHTVVLRPGTYVFISKSKDSLSKIVLQTNILSFITKKMILQKYNIGYQVENTPTQKIINSNDTLYTYNPTTSRVDTFKDSGQTQNNISGTESVQDIVSLDDKYFVTSTENVVPKLVNVSDGSIKDIDTDTSSKFVISSNGDGSFWIIHDNLLELYDEPYIKPVKTIKTTPGLLGYDISSTTDTILLSTKDFLMEEGGDAKILKPKILQINGNYYKSTNLNTDIYDGKISPDKKYIAFKDPSGFISLYNISSKKITFVDKLNVDTYEWKDGSTLVYSSDGGLWIFSTNKNYSSLYIKSSDPVVSYYDKSGIYYATYPDDLTSTVYKVPANKKEEEILKQLSEKLPYYSSNFEINYSFINSGKLFVTTMAGGDTISPAKAKLYYDNINRAKEEASKKIYRLGFSDLPVEYIQNQP